MRMRIVYSGGRGKDPKTIIGATTNDKALCSSRDGRCEEKKGGCSHAILTLNWLR